MNSNEVTIDEVALAAEADAAMLAAEPMPGAPVPAAEALSGDSWKQTIAGLTPMLRIGVFPQWEITEAEANEFAESLALCLEQVAPGGFNGPYACWLRLGLCCVGIPAARYLQNGKLPPLGPRRAVQDKESGTDSRADAAH